MKTKEAVEIGFENLSLIQKINAIDVIIDEKIREFL